MLPLRRTPPLCTLLRLKLKVDSVPKTSLTKAHSDSPRFGLKVKPRGFRAACSESAVLENNENVSILFSVFTRHVSMVYTFKSDFCLSAFKPKIGITVP